MNERIKELAAQVGLGTDHGGIVLTKNVNAAEALEKFAELIVKECLKQADITRDGFLADDEDHQSLGAEWVGIAIALHFGVEK